MNVNKFTHYRLLWHWHFNAKKSYVQIGFGVFASAVAVLPPITVAEFLSVYKFINTQHIVFSTVHVECHIGI